MKILITKALTLIALITLTFTAKAQSDYVITVNGDSIPCKIDTPVFGALRYKSATMAAAKKISSDEIKEAYIAENQSLYRAVVIDDDKKATYLTVIEKGKISLYQQIFVNNYNTSTVWYTGKSSDYVKVVKVTGGIYLGKPRAERKGDFAELLKDDKNVYDKFIADDKFGFDDIRNIVHLYNTGEQYNKDIGPVDLFAIDYIITNKNDTVRCRIKNDFFKGCFTFRENSKDDFIKIDSSYVNEYYYSRENTTFKLKTLPDQYRKDFLKLLEKGRINLYELATKTNNGKKNTVTYNWYVSKGTGPLTPIKLNAKQGDDIRSNKNLFKSFINVISDNKDLLKQYNEIFNHTSNNTDEVVKNCIDNYNYLYLTAQTANK